MSWSLVWPITLAKVSAVSSLLAGRKTEKIEVLEMTEEAFRRKVLQRKMRIPVEPTGTSTGE